MNYVPTPNTYHEQAYFGETATAFDDDLRETDHEDNIEIIRSVAEQGRTTEARNDCAALMRDAIQDRPARTWYLAHHTEAPAETVEDLADWRDISTPALWAEYRSQQIAIARDGYERWKARYRELCALRREIPKIAARAERRLGLGERAARAAFNETFYGEAA